MNVSVRPATIQFILLRMQETVESEGHTNGVNAIDRTST